jgi:hypothetical protein
MTITKPMRHGRRSSDSDDRIESLAAGTLPCRSCGVAVTTYIDTPVDMLTIFGQRNAQGFGTDVEIPVARCKTCVARRQRAAEILRAYPQIARENGNVGLDRLDAALAAFDVIGRPNLASTFTKTVVAVRELIDTFAALGGWSTWAPANAAPKVCESRRWGHVPANVRRDVQLALASLIKRRLEVPQPITPPSGHGVLRACGFCGIGSVIGKESHTVAIWGQPVLIPVASLGGRGSESLVAYLCPECRSALLATGAMGQPAVWLAAIRFRGFEPRVIDAILSIDGLVPWAVRRGAEPNTSPWLHINIAALDKELKFSTLVSRSTVATR